MKNLSYIPYVDSKVNDGYIEISKCLYFSQQTITKDKLINNLRFKELKILKLKIYG